jgi:hypothetical protein
MASRQWMWSVEATADEVEAPTSLIILHGGSVRMDVEGAAPSALRIELLNHLGHVLARAELAEVEARRLVGALRSWYPTPDEVQ